MARPRIYKIELTDDELKNIEVRPHEILIKKIKQS